ncbi:hypothetical protein ACIREE_18440 [Streptomyces sp. NPDC102467]|uniref:hypothetical protein n=1 Tax=Streptomyces sp. NPDC102467 TaxID=3366179 RepID=UPI0037FD1399
MAQSPNRRRITSAALIAAAGAVAVSIGVRLHSYGVPLALITPCVLTVLSSALWLLVHVEETWSSTLHRCTVKGCTFQVRVQHVDAAENRRWQEVAAAHPAHPTA